VAGPDVTVIRTQPPITPARQRSSDSNRTEPSDEKKGKLIIKPSYEVCSWSVACQKRFILPIHREIKYMKKKIFFSDIYTHSTADVA
jgi:hypothetical protein